MKCVNASCFDHQHYNETEKKCTSCPSESPRYNVIGHVCEPCPTKTEFDYETDECVPIVCGPDEVWSDETESCEPCPEDKPVLN